MIKKINRPAFSVPGFGVFLLIGFVLIFSHGFSQKTFSSKTNIEKHAKKLIGITLQSAIDSLGLAKDFSVVNEPFGVLRGIRGFRIADSLQVLLYVERTPYSISPSFNEPKSPTPQKNDFDLIKDKKIIGLSWKNKRSCGNSGKYLPQYAYNKFGPCD